MLLGVDNVPCLSRGHCRWLELSVSCARLKAPVAPKTQSFVGSALTVCLAPNAELGRWIAWVICFLGSGEFLLNAMQPPTVFQVRHGMRVHRFEVADNEWYVRGADGSERFETFPTSSAPNQRRALRPLAAVPEQYSPVAYELGKPKTPEFRRVILPEIWMRLSPVTDGEALVRSMIGVVLLGPKNWAPGWLQLRVTNPAETVRLVRELRGKPEVESVHPQLGRRYERDLIPDDPLFMEQWHLLATSTNLGTTGVDIDVTAVWDEIRGEGMVVGVLDDSVQLTHPDLASAVDRDYSYDFRDGDSDPSPVDLAEDLHGTGVSGFAVARGNNGEGVAGVAFQAKLAAIRLIGGSDLSDATIGEALTFHNEGIHVKNSSWGSNTSENLDSPAAEVEMALDDSISNGRLGRGQIFVFSAGNHGHVGDDLNYNMLKNRQDIIPVGSIIESGAPASYTTPGACLVVVAPGGRAGALSMRTTDLMGVNGQNAGGTAGDLEDANYTANFSGTSASAPIVSGVIALMLQANPNLGWRDVQEILMRSARKVSEQDAEWQTNSAGLHFHHLLGAGLVQASSAVTMAKGWKNLPPLRSQSLVQRDLDEIIPDDRTRSALRVFEFDGPPLRVEFAKVILDVTHPTRGQLEIVLTSPSGMTSQLAQRHPDRSDDWEFWTFTSRRHWGELSSGRWTLEIRDVAPRNAGVLNYARVELLGSLIGGVELVESQWSEVPGQGRVDGILSPGELIEERVVLRNVSGQSLEGVRIQLAQEPHSGALELQVAEAVFDPIPPGGTATNRLPLLYRINESKALCGATIPLQLKMVALGVVTTNTMSRRLGSAFAAALTESFPATEGLPLTVVDRSTVFATNQVVAPDQVIDEVRVSIRMDHTTVGDTQVSLIHPDGTEVMLSENRGGNNPDLGSGTCENGTLAVFSDSAPLSVRGVDAPFIGTYRPDQPLSLLQGKSVAGVWRLRISDVFDDDSGSLLCWALNITSRPVINRCDPFLALRLLSVASEPNGTIRIRAQTAQAGLLRVESSSDLNHWTPIRELSVGTGEFEIEDRPESEPPFRYYRLLAL